MAISEELSGFVKEALGRGLTPAQIEDALLRAASTRPSKTYEFLRVFVSPWLRRSQNRVGGAYGALAVDIPLNVSFCMPAPVCAI